MSDPRCHYQVLGVPREATAEEVRRRFRELVRKYHPDLHRDHPEFHEIFVRISQAYDVLGDATRRAHYDLSLRDRERREAARAAPPRPSPPPPRSAQRPPRPGDRARREADRRRQDVARLMHDARHAYARGHLREALRLCQEALQHGSVGAAYEMLGDIYSRQGRAENAIHNYTLAAQMQPNNGLIMAKLNRVVAHRNAQSRERFEVPRGPDVDTGRRGGYRLGVTCIGAAVVLFVMVWRPPEAAGAMGLPMVPNWTPFHATAMLLAGLLAGAVLAVAGWVRPIDQELFYQTVGTGRRAIPLGVPLAVLAAVFLPAALVVYLAASYFQQVVSASVLTLFGVATGLALGFALLPPLAVPAASGSAAMETLLFGGNVLFVTGLAGWFLGDLFRPGWTL